MTSRGDQTRDELIVAAERLFGARGIDGVSLREINQAAGQRNTAALQYHFGGRAGLLQAIIDRHWPPIAARQQELYDELVAAGKAGDLRSLVRVMIEPNAQCLGGGPSDRSWLMLCAELASRPQVAIEDMQAQSTRAAVSAGLTIVELLSASMPRVAAIERMLVVTQGANHVLADRARLEDAVAARRVPVPIRLFISGVIDAMCGALSASVSEETKALVGDHGEIRERNRQSPVPAPLPE